MAANIPTILKDIQIGQTEHLYWVKIVPSTSYPTGGEPLDFAANTHIEVLHVGAGVANGGYVTAWDEANQKLKIYRQKDPAAAGGADIPLPEVANAVDLSGVTFFGLAIGS
jgi:hypothetical protein